MQMTGEQLTTTVKMLIENPSLLDSVDLDLVDTLSFILDIYLRGEYETKTL